MTRRVAIVANDHVGTRMAGPGIRSYRLARELAGDFDVTLVVPFPTDLTYPGIRIVQDDPWDARRMKARLRGFDAVFAQRLPVPTMRALARDSSVLAIYDLYAPVMIESLAWAAEYPRSRRLDATNRLNTLTQQATLECGDAFVCASEKQRDLWLGSLLALGRINQDLYAADPSLRTLVDVVPFGIEPTPPASPGPVLKGVVPGIGPDDKVLLWGGGIWNWFDPLTVIRAVERLSRQRDDVRLYFLGLHHPNPAVPQMAMQQRALDLAEELSLTDRIAFFNVGWIPYEERGAYYLEADVGVSAHVESAEARFAYRTRLLDCFWAGLPVVTTGGDTLGELVRERGLGRALEVGDVDGWVEALDRLLDDARERKEIAVRLERVRSELAWPRVAKPLGRLLQERPRSAPGRGAALTHSRYISARLENAVLQHGPRKAAGQLLRQLTRRAAPAVDRARPPRR